MGFLTDLKILLVPKTRKEKPDGDEFPDSGSFKALIVENEDMVEELFNLSNLKELVEEDVTDVMQN
ncbi:hypothetical protein Ciccas_001809 [Cichlidogyrus casuarinus]|uniref:Uncharacterized protein n=1 Tax=Cichlidogyrus casuarinus TaxID=1844966 RepID=A0ABD2QJI7_9PLAT